MLTSEVLLKERGQRLKDYRLQAKKSQMVFASSLYTNASQISRYEKGKCPMSKNFITALVSYTDMDVGWLLRGERVPEYQSYVSILCKDKHLESADVRHPAEHIASEPVQEQSVNELPENFTTGNREGLSLSLTRLLRLVTDNQLSRDDYRIIYVDIKLAQYVIECCNKRLEEVELLYQTRKLMDMDRGKMAEYLNMDAERYRYLERSGGVKQEELIVLEDKLGLNPRFVVSGNIEDFWIVKCCRLLEDN